MRPWRSLGLLLAFATVSAGCGPTCQTTCSRFYEEEECDAKPAGLPIEEALSSCVNICEEALDVPGTVDANDRRFNPEFIAPTNQDGDERNPGNEAEAAAWMDCVWSFEERDQCRTKLDDAFCVKVF